MYNSNNNNAIKPYFESKGDFYSSNFKPITEPIIPSQSYSSRKSYDAVPVMHEIRNDLIIGQGMTDKYGFPLSGGYNSAKESYQANQDNENNNINQTEYAPQDSQIHFSFLKPNRPVQRFIGAAEEIIDAAKECYNKILKKKLPGDIQIVVLNEKEFAEVYNESSRHKYSPGILGFAKNPPAGLGIKQIFVKENPLDILFIVLGHELGHVLTERVNGSKFEEAKAFAFELAWIKAIVENNILNLRSAIDFSAMLPAKNGIHDKGYELVHDYLQKGYEPILIYNMISAGEITTS